MIVVFLGVVSGILAIRFRQRIPAMLRLRRIRVGAGLLVTLSVGCSGGGGGSDILGGVSGQTRVEQDGVRKSWLWTYFNDRHLLWESSMSSPTTGDVSNIDRYVPNCA